MNKKILTTLIVAMTTLFAVARNAGDHAHPVPHANSGRTSARAGRQGAPRQARPRQPRRPRAPRIPRVPHIGRQYRGGYVPYPYPTAPRVVYVNGIPQTTYVMQSDTQLVAPATTTTQPVYVCNQTTQTTGRGTTPAEAQLNATSVKPVETKVFNGTNGWIKVVGEVIIDSKGKVILPKEYQQYHVKDVNQRD